MDPYNCQHSLGKEVNLIAGPEYLMILRRWPPKKAGSTLQL